MAVDQRKEKGGVVVKPNSSSSFFLRDYFLSKEFHELLLDAKTVSNTAVAAAVFLLVCIPRSGYVMWTACGLAVTMVPYYNGISYNVLRWPLLLAVCAIVILELWTYAVLRLFVRAVEMAIEDPTRRELRRTLNRAEDYESWLACARALDATAGIASWQADVESTTYNWPFIKGKIVRLREARRKRDWRSVVRALRTCVRPNVGGIKDPRLFSATHTGDPKILVSDFIKEVSISIQWLTTLVLDTHAALVRRQETPPRNNGTAVAGDDDDSAPRFSEVAAFNNDGSGDANRFSEIAGNFRDAFNETNRFSEVVIKTTGALTGAFREESFSRIDTTREFFATARESYGKTALCLSGGGALGTYHIGVIRALWKEGVLPDVLCGTSAGGLISSFVCTRDDDELERDLMDDGCLQAHLCCFDQTPLECAVHWYKHGSMYDGDRFLEMSRFFSNDSETGIRDMTFLEAYQRSGRHLSLTACSREGKRAPPVLLNHLTSPHVVIASALIATCGVPGLIPPVVLRVKDPDTGNVSPSTASETYIDGSIVTDIPAVALKEAFNARFIVASQVNPHIAPMLYHTHGSVGDPTLWFNPTLARTEDPWRGGFVVAAAELFLKRDMFAKLQFLRDIDAAPGWSGRFLTQKFEGDITITPSLRLLDYFQIFKNPDEHTLPRFLREGRVAAYQKISMIRSRLDIERALAKSCTDLETALEAARPDQASGHYLPTTFRWCSSGTEHHAWMREVVQRRRSHRLHMIAKNMEHASSDPAHDRTSFDDDGMRASTTWTRELDSIRQFSL
ncbi:hypothetical protein CTAYLR_008956 [Chrysophaeum taylorii]|uniref:PNPLA domain-containing protein n=1 Tax=Chrysophaeum taylorii TaxID=2483200 RepID=A0AAD7XR90_9STRA|nr:hypothetical protein CTAYLR_008956 [Chrysophaeum taylorii]